MAKVEWIVSRSSARGEPASLRKITYLLEANVLRVVRIGFGFVIPLALLSLVFFLMGGQAAHREGVADWKIVLFASLIVALIFIGSAILLVCVILVEIKVCPAREAKRDSEPSADAAT
jgi:hypothetical protein